MDARNATVDDEMSADSSLKKLSRHGATKKRILKNLLSLAFGHFLVFTAFDSLSNLQSTMNQDGSVGIASQAIIYAFFTVSSFFLPTFLITKVGCKTALVVSVFSISPYVIANMYPCWETLIPTAAVAGLAFGPLWAARSTYVNELSYSYSELINGRISVVNAWFFGIYSFFHEKAEIWGNVISYFVLKNANSSEIVYYNETNWTCGAYFCTDLAYVSNPNLTPPSEEKRHTLCLIYTALVVAAGIIIKVLLDPLKNNDYSDAGSSCSLFVATVQQLKKKNQLLLIPLSFYCGLADGFYNSDFTKSFIACSWGISWVGFVTISYGVVCAVMDCILGLLVKHLGRTAVFLFGAFSHFVMLTACLVWKPTPESPFVFFILAGAYGLGASIWWSQIAAFCGVVFKDDQEAAFSNFYFWSSLGLLIAYAYSDFVCTYIKIILLLVLLAVGIVTYIMVERKTSEDVKVTESELSESASLRSCSKSE